MTRPQNPYIAGNPISDQDRFIGRADVMRETLRVLRNPNANAIILHGQRRIGKTSILLRLEKDLAGDDYCSVYFDLQDKAAMPLSDVLYQLAQTIAPATNSELPHRSHFDNEGNFFRNEFLPVAVKHAAPRSLVLLFDEFDVLDLPQEGQAGSVFFPYLRTWMAKAAGVTFVFVLGRRPEELSTDTLATFKGTQSYHVSLISQSETLEIARLSEKNQTLYWTNDALEQIWQLTQGHPYFTQLLCSRLWDTAYGDMPTEPPTTNAGDVEEAVADALDKGANTFQWIWRGLPASERIVMAAIAEESSESIRQERLVEILNRSGVRLILRELELAPETLEKWDLLRRVVDINPSNINNHGATYRFAIPLLKRWVRENKPLRRVKADLDEIEPLAKSLYQSATIFYDKGDFDRAKQLLNNALDVNPNHMQSRLLLGRVQLGLGNPAAAIATLETVYAFDPQMGRQGYLAALLAQADQETIPDQQLVLCNRILQIEPDQPIAKEKRATVWRQKASDALRDRNYEDSLYFYQQLRDSDAVNNVLILRRKDELAELMSPAIEYERTKQWTKAIKEYNQLMSKFPDEEILQQRFRGLSDYVATIEQKLNFYNPLNYLRLLWWILIAQKSFETFKGSLSNDQTKRLRKLGALTINALNWELLIGYGIWLAAENSIFQPNNMIIYVICTTLILSCVLIVLFGDSFLGVLVFATGFVGTIAIAFAGASISVGANTFITLAIIVIAVALVVWVTMAISDNLFRSDDTSTARFISVMLGTIVGTSLGTVVFAATGAIEIILMESLLIMPLLLLVGVSLRSSIVAGIVVGICCGGVVYWLTGQLIGPSFIQSAISFVISAVAIVLDVFIVSIIYRIRYLISNRSKTS